MEEEKRVEEEGRVEEEERVEEEGERKRGRGLTLEGEKKKKFPGLPVTKSALQDRL